MASDSSQILSARSFLSSLASQFSLATQDISRSSAPVNADGAVVPKPRSNAFAEALQVLNKTAGEVHALAKNGPAFHPRDIPAYINAVQYAAGGDGIDDRKMLLEKLLVLMSRLPSESEFARNLEIFTIGILYKDLPHPPAGYLAWPDSAAASTTSKGSYYLGANGSGNGHANGHSLNGHANGNGNSHHEQERSDATYVSYEDPESGKPKKSYTSVPYAARSADGSNYNQLFPEMGAARRPYARTVPPVTAINRQMYPDAGTVFDSLLRRQPTPHQLPASSTSSSSSSSSIFSTLTNSLLGHREDFVTGPLPSSSPDAKPGHTTLPPTDSDGFARHPGGFSSFFFAFADLIIHSCFNTDHAAWNINNASSYLDLSPLYGSSDEENAKVRRMDGSGRLWEDVFADSRILFMPPNVCALLVLFCRNHNYVASKLLAINEWGYYNSDLSTFADEDKFEEMQKQDDELYNRARLVNCAWFTRIILQDYVGAILGLQRDGESWRLDPLAESRDLDHTLTARGQGNVVAFEFNLMYRWHATLSKPDTAWTERAFGRLLDTREYSKITVNNFMKIVAKKIRPPADVREWVFEGVNGTTLSRDSTGAFKTTDLAALMQSATSASASAFKARGIPEVLRVVEIMGIEQARSWGACTMNEFRKFMGLKPFATFRDWNSDPEISRTAETLYGHIDNLELYVGLQAEEAKPPIPGAGLCPGYTISRAILADATALVRGDRFLTTEFTVYNLSSWGYQDCQPVKDDGTIGGMIPRLLYRTLPGCYPENSAYARFPFLVPQTMKGYLSKQVNSTVSQYSFDPPSTPLLPQTVKTYDLVKEVIRRKDVFESALGKRLAKITGPNITKEWDSILKTINSTIESLNNTGRYSRLFNELTDKLVKESSVKCPGSSIVFLDVVKDVINLVPVYFTSMELAGLPLKTKESPRGVWEGVEIAEMARNVSSYLITNMDAYEDWPLKEKSAKVYAMVLKSMKSHAARITGKGAINILADTMTQWYTGEDDLSDSFIKKILSYPNISPNAIATGVFACVLSTCALFSKCITHIVDRFLDEENEEIRANLVRCAFVIGAESDDILWKYTVDALRANPPMPVLMRSAKRPYTLGADIIVQPGQDIYASILDANEDRMATSTILGLEDMGFTEMHFLRATVPGVLRSIFRLKNLRRSPGANGSLSKVVEKNDNGYTEINYLDLQSRITPFPVSMLVQYDA